MTRIFLTTELYSPETLTDLLLQVISTRQSRPPKNVEVAKLLLIFGANVNSKNRRGK